MTTERSLWTPDAIEYIQSWRIEEDGVPVITEDGRTVFKHEFRLSYRGESEFFGVLAEDDASDAQVEDMAAATAERALQKIEERLQRRADRATPEQLADPAYWDRRRDLAAVWRDFLKHAKKRRASSNGKLYYPGIKDSA